jgi:hypothetical protein
VLIQAFCANASRGLLNPTNAPGYDGQIKNPNISFVDRHDLFQELLGLLYFTFYKVFLDVSYSSY